MTQKSEQMFCVRLRRNRVWEKCRVMLLCRFGACDRLLMGCEDTRQPHHFSGVYFGHFRLNAASSIGACEKRRKVFFITSEEPAAWKEK